ncbi:hypothetical protein A0H81_11630 [Grifola frondosa]|uniref:Uncharacterized protein n=1 Tax=Grifola frondosa TaxID=5627 RepID=A0A1C7LU99_GRIFR|nr:hypothetical protein A0H81_11630 [Grifola frondosa]
MEFVRLGLKLLVVCAATTTLATAGFLLSILSAIGQFLLPCSVPTGPPHVQPLLRPTCGDDPTRSHPSPESSPDASPEVRSPPQSPTALPRTISPEPMFHEERSRSLSPHARDRAVHIISRSRRPLSNGGKGLPASAPHPVPKPSRQSHEPRSLSEISQQSSPRVLSAPDLVSELSTSQLSELPAVALDEVPSRCRPQSPTRRLLYRVTSTRSNLKEHCPLRVHHTLPTPKRQKPIMRTDPYQAPYFFPTPLSPQADTYVHQVRNERAGVPDMVAFRQPRQDLLIGWSPPKETATLPPQPSAEIVPQVPQKAVQSRSSIRRSWHIPLPISRRRRTSSVDAVEQKVEVSGAGSADAPPSPTSIFRLGHGKRHHASTDLRTA